MTGSIRHRLLVTLLGAVLAAGVAGSLAIYQVTLGESDDIMDYHLHQVALSLAGNAVNGGLPGRTVQEEAQYDFVVQIWDPSGDRLYLSHPHSSLPDFAQLGFASVSNAEGRWRTYSYATQDHIIQVAQPMAVRERLAAGMALRVLIPFLIIMPLLGLLVWRAIGRGLQPLARVADAVAARSPDSLAPLGMPDVPAEMQPLVTALNDLLARLAHALDSLKALSADAAHELRTPLAALLLQAQVVERSRDEAERSQAMARLKAGLRRATHVVEQLLTLARQEGLADSRPTTPVDLRGLAGEVTAEMLPLAQAKDIDLGVVATVDEARIAGDGAALHILLANLIDNALRYTPDGGRVDVELAECDGRYVLGVTDTGPGIPAGERQRVFDRFYRGAGQEAPGSGLGLAIARRIAERHGASLSLADNPRGRGLSVSLAFPPPA